MGTPVWYHTAPCCRGLVKQLQVQHPAGLFCAFLQDETAAFNFPISCSLHSASVSLLYASQQKHIHFCCKVPPQDSAWTPPSLTNLHAFPLSSFHYFSPPAFFCEDQTRNPPPPPPQEECCTLSSPTFLPCCKAIRAF